MKRIDTQELRILTGIAAFMAVLLLGICGVLPARVFLLCIAFISCLGFYNIFVHVWRRLRPAQRGVMTGLCYAGNFIAIFGTPYFLDSVRSVESYVGGLIVGCNLGLLVVFAFNIYILKKKNMRKKIVAGNWKMNTLPAEGVELAEGVVAGRNAVSSEVSFIVCPPFTHLSRVAEALAGSSVELGAQNCAAEAKGAYTGEVSAAMLAALGCKYVILGHSERRQYYGETSETLNKKMEQAYANSLTPIYCVGENLAEREAGRHFEVVSEQIEEVVYNLSAEQFADLVIAYEPVWAIGTGKTATAEQAEEIHAHIRKVLAAKFGGAAEQTPILYGGSCKPSNAAEIFAKKNVDGGLIGGAALKAEDFLAIGKGFGE